MPTHAYSGYRNTPTVERCVESLHTSLGRGLARLWASRASRYSNHDKMAVLGFAYAYVHAPEGFLTYQAVADHTGIDKDAVKALIREWWEYHQRPVGSQDVKAVMHWIASAP